MSDQGAKGCPHPLSKQNTSSIVRSLRGKCAFQVEVSSVGLVLGHHQGQCRHLESPGDMAIAFVLKFSRARWVCCASFRPCDMENMSAGVSRCFHGNRAVSAIRVRLRGPGGVVLPMHSASWDCNCVNVIFNLQEKFPGSRGRH